MLRYLLDYDIIIKNEDGFDYNDIDINDRTILQEQINNTRKKYSKMIQLYDSLQSDIIEAKSELSERNRNLYNNCDNRNERTEKRIKDKEIAELELKIEAINESINLVKNQMNFLMSDIKILTNSMYMK